jgi:hypothetical protein
MQIQLQIVFLELIPTHAFYRGANNASGLIYMKIFYGLLGPLGGEMNAPIKNVFVRILTI